MSVDLDLETSTNIKVTPTLKSWLDANGYRPQSRGHSQYVIKAAEAMANEDLDGETYLSLVNPQATKDMRTMSTTKSVTGDDLYGGGKSTERSFGRMKDPSESLSEKRVVGTHKKTGQPVVDPIYGQPATLPSEASAARAGVLLKHLAARAGIQQARLSEWEHGLLDEVAEKQTWCGKVGTEWHDRIPGGSGTKQLIDDAVSGGLEVVPTEFDADVITFPLLGGELFPYVDLKPVERGRRIEGASIATPTLAWGQGDAATVGLFNTANMVLPVDTTIFGVAAAVRVGRDFLADSPVNIGATLTALIGDRLSNELDRVIAVGAGGVEPPLPELNRNPLENWYR